MTGVTIPGQCVASIGINDPIQLGGKVLININIHGHGHAGAGLLSSYPIEITRDPAYLLTDNSIGIHGVIPYDTGFVSTVDGSTNGKLQVTGYDPRARGRKRSCFASSTSSHNRAGILRSDFRSPNSSIRPASRSEHYAGSAR